MVPSSPLSTQLHPGEYGYDPSTARTKKRTAPTDDDGDDGNIASRRSGEASGVDKAMDIEDHQAVSAGLATPPVPAAERGTGEGGATAAAEVEEGKDEDVLRSKDEKIAVGYLCFFFLCIGKV